MAFSDSESDDDSDDDDLGGLGSYMQHQANKKTQVTDFEAFEDGDENTVVDKMKTILALRESLGMDDDVVWQAQQKEKEEADKREANMTMEEKSAASGDMMARIRDKHLQKQKLIDEEKAKKEDEERALRAKMALEAAQQESDEGTFELRLAVLCRTQVFLLPILT